LELESSTLRYICENTTDSTEEEPSKTPASLQKKYRKMQKSIGAQPGLNRTQSI